MTDETKALNTMAGFLEEADERSKARLMHYLTDRFFPDGQFVAERESFNAMRLMQTTTGSKE